MTALLGAHACNSTTDTVCHTVQVLSLADHGAIREFMPLVAVLYVNTR